MTTIAPAEFDVFMSYNSSDHEPVERIARGLKERGLSVFLDRWELIPGRSWPQALEEQLARCRCALIVLGPSGMGSWQQRERQVALDRQARDGDFGVIPVLLPGADPALGFLSLNTWVDLREGLSDPQILDLLAAAIRGEPPSSLAEQSRQAASQVCPYRGLEVFREEDAPFFFGRETFAERLFQRTSARDFVAVVGASGSGKSSVVRAGLIPMLRHGTKDTSWDVLTLTPGAEPLAALARALDPPPAGGLIATRSYINGAAASLRAGDVKLQQLIDDHLARQPGTDRLLLVVDQFEELATLAASAEEASRFIDLLLEATGQARGLTVLITLRSDFYTQIVHRRDLSDRLQDGVVQIGPLSSTTSEGGLSELETIIRRPAEAVGLDFEDGLVPRIIADVGDEPGNLPLLEYLLTELWRRRGRGLLTHEAYEALGGVQGAIARRADEAYDQLAPEQQRAARRLFLSLIRPGEGQQDTRTPAPFPQNPLEVEVARRFSGPKLRLLVADEDALRGRVIQLSHEALIRNWSRLRGWIDGNREQLRRRELIRSRMRTWQEDGEPPDRLLASGRELEEGRTLLAAAEDVPIADIVPYVQRSIARSERRRTLTRLSIAAVFLVLSAALIVTLQQWQRAEQKTVEAASERTRAEQRAVEATRQANLAQGREIAIRAESILDSSIGSTSLAGALAVESLRLADTIEGRQVLASVMALTPRGVEPVETPWRYTKLHYSPTGDLLLQSTYRGHDSSPASGSVSLIDPRTLDPMRTFELPGWSWPAISPNGKWMAISGHARQLLVLDLETGAPRLDLGYKAQIDARFSPDSQRLFVARADGVLETRTAPDWSLKVEHRFAEASPSLDGVALSVPTVPGPLVVDTTASAYLLPADGSPAQELHTQGGRSVRLAIIDPPGRRAFTSQWGRVETIWDAGSGAKIAGLDLGSELKAARFSPDGVRLATAAKDGEIALWDAASGKRLASFSVGKSASSVDFSPDGALLAAGGEAEVTLWDLKTSKKTNVWPQIKPTRKVAFGGDGRSLLIADDTNVLHSVNLDTGDLLARSPLAGPIVSIAGHDASGHLAVGVGNSDSEQSWLDMQAVDPGTGEVKWTLQHNGAFSQLAFRPDGGVFATSTYREDKVKIWDAEIGALTRELDTDGYVKTYTGDSKRLLLGGDEQLVLDADTYEKLGTIGEPGGIRETAFLEADGLLVTYGKDGTLRGWDIATGNELWRRALAGRPELGQQGRHYLVRQRNKPWRIFDTLRGDQIAEIPTWEQSDAQPRAISISADGRRLLRISFVPRIARAEPAAYTQVEIWNLEKEKRIFSDRYESHFIEGRFLPGGRAQILDKAGGLDVLDTETGARLWGIPELRGGSSLLKQLPPTRAQDPLVVTGATFTELRDQRSGSVLARYEEPLAGIILADDPSLMVAAPPSAVYREQSPEPSLSVRLMDWRTGRKRWSTQLPLDIAANGQAAYIQDLVPSPDGERLLVQTAGNRAQLIILDITDGDILGKIEADSDWKASWPLPDPDLMLASDRSSTVRVWRLSTGEEVYRFAHTHTATGVAVAESSSRAVTYSGASLRVWDLENLSQVAARRVNGDVEKVAIRPDGRQVAYVTGRDRKSDSGATFTGIVLWDVDGDEEPRVVPIETVIGKLAYSRDGAWIAAGIGRRRSGLGRSVRVWDVETLRPMLTVESLPSGLVNEFSFSADGKQLILRERSEESKFGHRIWDIAARREIARLDGSELLEVPNSTDVLVRNGSSWRRWNLLAGDFERLPWSESGWKLQVSPDGRNVTTTSSESFCSLDVETGSALSLQPIPPDEEFKAHQVAANGDLVAFAQRKLDPFRPGAVSLRKLPDGQELANARPDATITFLAFADGGESLILGGNPGGWATYGESEALFLWRWRTGQLKAVNNDQPAEALAINPNGTSFVTGEGDWDSSTDPWTIVGTPQIREWDARTGKLLRSLQLDDPVGGVAFSPSGRYLAAQNGPKVQIIRAEDWEPLQEFQLQLGSTTPLVRFASDNLLVAADGRGLRERSDIAGIRVWALDGSSDRMLQTDKNHVPFALSRDGLAIAARDGDILRVWDLESGAQLTRHRFGDGFDFAFAGKGDQLFVQSRDHKDVLLKVPWRLEDVLADACRRLQRELDKGEQRRYLRRVSDSAGCASRSAAPNNSGY